MVRQGNMNKEVSIFIYITEATFDAYSYQLVENKQKFISQIMTSKSPARSCEDLDEAALSYAEVKALAAGNPMIKEKMDLDIQVARLRTLKAAYNSQHYRLEDAVTGTFPREIRGTECRIQAFEKDMQTAKDSQSYDKDGKLVFSIELDGTTYDKREDAGKALLGLVGAAVRADHHVLVGHYAGFEVTVAYVPLSKVFVAHLVGQATHTTELGSDAAGNMVRLQNVVAALPQEVSGLRNNLQQLRVQLDSAKEELQQPFLQEQELNDKSARLESQLSVIKDPQQLGQLYPTYIQKKRTTSNRTEVRKKLNFCLERATNYAQFLQMAQELGISVCQRGKHITYLLEGAGRAIRDTSLADTDKFTYTGLMERLEDNAAEQLFIRERIAKMLPNVSTFADFTKVLQSEGVKIRVKKQSEQLLYKAVNLDGTWIPADALGDGFTLGGLKASMKSGFENLDEGHGTPIADLYRELTTEYPQNCDTSVRLTARQICSAGKRGVLLQIQDANGNPAKLMMDNRHIHTTSDGTVTADIGAAFSYDITYDDGTHGTIRGTDLIRQIDEANLTQPLTVSLTADQIIAMSLRGVTVQLPQYGIERLFIPEHYVQRNVEQGSCAISLYPAWQYSYVPTGNEKTRKAISGADLAQSLGGMVQVDSSADSLARRVANVERRAGIANAQALGKILGGMADNGLHSAADFDKQINKYRRKEIDLRNRIANLHAKNKTYAVAAHSLQVCKTYKSVWMAYASQPQPLKETYYKQNEAVLQTYSRAASQLDKMEISLGTEPEKVRQLVTVTESRIADLIAELEKVRKSNRAIQEDKEKVEQIQGG